MGSSSNNNNNSTTSNGGVPPGFRFHPTDEELLHYYLKKKVCFHKFEMEVIRDVDLNKLEPWDLQERCRIGSTPQNEWYFFSHKDRKYPTGSRTNRATNAGFWKATGRDKCIRNTFQKIGMRKTLVFYRGRAPHGHKTDWIMHEYRLEDSDHQSPDQDHSLQEDGWVVCRVFKKKNLFKVGGTANEGGSSSTTTYNTNTNTNNNLNINNIMKSPTNHHHQHLQHHQLLLDNNNTTPSMQANMQYYNLLRGPNNNNPMHYLMPTTTPTTTTTSFELNNKPHTEDHHHSNNNINDHDLALHTYLPQHHHYYATPSANNNNNGNNNVDADDHDHWTSANDGVDSSSVLIPSSLSHNSNGNNNSAGMMISNRLSLGATTTAEMDFWGGYAK